LPEAARPEDRPAVPAVRASDADRDRVAAALHAAFAEGRLTMPELEERLAGAYAAGNDVIQPPRSSATSPSWCPKTPRFI